MEIRLAISRSRIASAKAGFTTEQQQYYDLLTWKEIEDAEIDQKGYC